MSILINADDLGLSQEANLGIVQAFSKGWCHRTTFAANSGYSEEGARLAERYGFADKTGLHLNVCEGEPLTNEIKEFPKYVKKGVFDYTPQYMKADSPGFSPLHTYSCLINSDSFKDEIHALKIEFEAQIRRFLDFGFTLRHIDSHRNCMIDLPAWIALKPLLVKYNFTSIRGLYFSFHTSEIFNIIYSQWISNEINCLSSEQNSFVSSITKYLAVNPMHHDRKKIELYIHPILINGTLIDNFTGGKPLYNNIKALYAAVDKPNR